MKISKDDRENLLAELRGLLNPGDTVYTILRHVSASGMSRDISAYLLGDKPFLLDWYIERVLGLPRSRKEGVRVGGAGMDMGYHLVYSLSHTLFPNGFACIGEGCPSNDHANGDRNRKPHQHTGGGYALKQSWL